MRMFCIRVISVFLLTQGLLVSNVSGKNINLLKLIKDFNISKACIDDKSKCTDSELETVEKCHENPFLCDDRTSRLSAYQPNYAIYQSTSDDENSLEVHYSFKYLFTKPHCMPLKDIDEVIEYPDIDCLRNYRNRSEWFFTFTGEFDFYMGTRDSSPVINRVSNPAFHWRKHFGNSLSNPAFSVEWFNLGIEHRSNGQAVNADAIVNDVGSPDYGRYRAQVEYENGNHKYFDGISRGANYFSLESRINVGPENNNPKECHKNPKCLSIWLSAKLYFSENSNIYWGPLANKNIKISDYDRAKLIISDTFKTDIKFFPSLELGLEWTVGDELLDTDSLNVYVSLPWVPKNSLKIPFYLRAHFGPMSTLSNYTKEQNSIGIGVNFR